MRYAIVVEKAGNNYSAYAPDLPGCIATGSTVKEAEQEILEAIKFHIDGLREDGLPIPASSSVVEYLEIAANMSKSIGPLDFENISISPKYRKNDWQQALSKKDWRKMVEIFEDRIESRFLKPIRLIANDPYIGEFSGFSILALDCLIIETLNQFYSGLDETEGKHDEAFWNFFKKSEFFRGHFSRKKAFTFYSHYRCGILHQAQTKKKSVVRMDQNTMIQSVEKDISIGLIVDRSRFHEALENEISSYIEKLKIGGNDESHSLRSHFIKKMNIICGIPNEPV